jgi:uncharacterized protein (DUF697 family)
MNKYFLDSSTIRGILLTLVPTISTLLKLFGIEIGAEEQQGIIEGIAGIIGAIGIVIAIIGRKKATMGIRFNK